MTSKTMLNMFDDYRRARITFVQTVADLALRPQNFDVLKSAHVLDLLRPLLSDICVQIQQCAAVAIGRLAHHDPVIGSEMLQGDILTVLLKNIEKRNKYYKKSAMFVLRSVCKHDAEIAGNVINAGGLEALMLCLADHESEVKESASWATGYIARHNHQLARAVVDAGAVPHLVLCLQEPELCVKRVAASALADIAKHGPDLAQNVVDAGAVAHLARATGNRDEKLRRQALMALSAVARHGAPLAECCVQAEVFPGALVAMGHSCSMVRRNAAMLVRDIVRHSAELAQLVANVGGVGALVEAVRGGEQGAEARVPAMTALGYIAGHGPQLAGCVVSCNGVTAIADILCEPRHEEELLCVTVWAVGQLGRHCPEAVAGAATAATVSTAGGQAAAACSPLARLLQLYRRAGGEDGPETEAEDEPSAEGPSQEVRGRCRVALRQCVQGCTTLSALEPLLHMGCPPDILKHVLAQFAKVLPNDPRARRLFVTTGGLQKVQEISAEPGSPLMEYVTLINACFPEEIVRYYTPGYPDTLLEKVEQFVPKLDMGEDGGLFDSAAAAANELNNAVSRQNPSANNSQEIINYLG